MSIKYLDAKRLRRILIGGGQWIKKHEEYLNELNVYPVPDGDTGTNMSMTVETMINDINNLTDKNTSMEELSNIVEEAVLMGARGNSGTILSQVITGFLKGTENKKRLLVEDVYKALKVSKEVAYKAVETPVEGTILTVIREVYEEAERIYKDDIYLDEMIDRLVIVAKNAVEKTPELLPKLKEAGVVDSGAMGLYYFFEGIQKVLTEINLLMNFNKEERDFNKKISSVSHNIEDITFSYCTEFVIRNIGSDNNIEDLKKIILGLGDSVVFAETSKKFKTHVHTNNPGLVLENALKFGELEKVKIENMRIQNETLVSGNSTTVYFNNKKSFSKYNYIAVADTEELKDVFFKLGADVVILGGQSQNPSVSTIFEAVNKITNNKKIVILPNNKNIISTAKLAVEKLEQDILVLNTKTMLEGYYYLMYKDDNLENNIKDYENNYSIEITRAVREVTIDNKKINIDDYMAIVNGKIEIVNVEISDLFDELREKYITSKTMNLTVVEGINKSESIDVRLEKLKKEIPGELEIISTKQESYNYYILIENKPSNMPDIAILTDTSSDLEVEEMNVLPIYTVPLNVEIDGVTYLENVDLTKKELWDKLKTGKKFKTSQPSPKSIMDTYKRIFRKGYKKIIALNISKEMSGTYQLLKTTASKLDKVNDIHVINSEAIGVYLGTLVLNVANKSKNGESLDKILDYIEKFKKKTKLLIYIKDLEQIQKGGRLSATAKTFADFLSLKPIITMSGGRLVVDKKCFGESQALKYIEKEIIEESKKQSIYVIGTWGGDIQMKEYMYQIFDRLKNESKIHIIYDEHILGTAIGSHSGPMFGICTVPRLL